ncbi:MAG TPA: hypothetical protein VGH76_02765 [Actinomycetospora sp.]|jgi:hypothetical protein|uniref:hypothetical protein n=1 Tax=Actinomycetospora sp. TaxID=1872135 RepID=UPI002F426005
MPYSVSADEVPPWSAGTERWAKKVRSPNWRRSSRHANSDSHAVIVVSGSAAASAKDSVRGIGPTMRSSTAWNCAFAPCRAIEPAC